MRSDSGVVSRFRPWVLLALWAGGFILLMLVASVTSNLIGTSLIRVVVGLAMGIIVAKVGIGYFKQLTNPPPPDPVPETVPQDIGLTYVCSICGLELAVVKVARDKAPRHCSETMLLRVEGI